MGSNSINSLKIPFSIAEYDPSTNKIRSELVNLVSHKSGCRVTEWSFMPPNHCAQLHQLEVVIEGLETLQHLRCILGGESKRISQEVSLLAEKC